MFFTKLLQKRQATKRSRENMQAVNNRISRNQELVYRALVALNRPSNLREIAAKLGWDSGSVGNRLTELTRKGRIQIAYRKKGLDSMWRNYYRVSRHSPYRADD